MPVWNKGFIANEPSVTCRAAQAQRLANLGQLTASVSEVNTLCDGLGATAIEITNKCDGSKIFQSTGTGTSYTILAANTGKIHTMGPIASSQTMTLPTAADGLSFRFIYFSTADEGQNFILKSPAAAAYFRGGVMHSDTDGNTVATVYSDGNSNDNFTMVVPGAGTDINVLCDGTVWYIWGVVCGATVPTLAD